MAYDLLNLDGEVFRYDVETQAGERAYLSTCAVVGMQGDTTYPKLHAILRFANTEVFHCTAAESFALPVAELCTEQGK